ncbi:uncharacterized protein OCT59_016522 [Rhizophagus irregularis]|uniref:Uncharacterized protein n=2 Tax=Rhizophagus irregularis TaxID=588596 RepID=U9SVU9_RHIID|nr:hypothetical protein GLOIN_2v1697858 [Rhizophagus irregularis DAOM 181602=DAOM 197198]EXX73005.1 hypothetical protein RirG_064080 [Rhizophagus irregularis DAOM 197198w]UZO24208.1 hypothetical protein OCT59_016522 [Rhizophagus irregularis]POG62219.1 hypothetical protein GLOIN_2v1697858 [Rhizophagus irregularis DAOM 181602=DAOM 197198]CAG8437969.1 11560_t:CDS:2 [Rhizophagus irregularis]GBC15261.1 carbohydrate-binding module family 19 protein [Rhizophagus irregularis DAOM 181602=DAOM 197198]|eukprot:XP_025169085.1 hypothetical protein GLOIN_2v1697858 [Rhizophagus irregularis DAOM 181602=DAOM 197198]
MSQLRVLIISAIIAILAFAALSSSYVIKRDIADIRKQNAKDAQALQDKFETFTEDTECEPDQIACIKGDFAKCATVATEDGKLVNKYQIQKCNTGLTCFALPLVTKPGTSLVCTTKEDRDARFDQAKKNLKR